MPSLGRKPSWQQQLRRTKAKEWLLAGRIDKFPLLKIQNIAQALLKDKSPLLRKITPQSDECDILFANELLSVKGELGIHESAILACLHLLSCMISPPPDGSKGRGKRTDNPPLQDHQGRGQILTLRPDPKRPDLFFERRLDVYLQCVILSRRANPELCSEEERSAAEDLLGVVQGRAKDFPSILRLLEAVGNETCEAVLPLSLVKKALKTNHYQENLTRELSALKAARQWFDAYKLVYSLRKMVGLPRTDQMLREIFPDYPMWAAWRPDPKRLMSWESPNLASYRSRLFPVLDLEGPDITGQQRGTLRMSSPGAFMGLSEPARSADRHLLDRLLDNLDASLAVGPETVDLLVALCVERSLLSERTLSQLESVIGIGEDVLSKTLATFVRALTEGSDVITSMAVFASALPVMCNESGHTTFPFRTLQT